MIHANLPNLLTGAWALRKMIEDLKNSPEFETLKVKAECIALDDSADALEEIVRLENLNKLKFDIKEAYEGI